MVMREDELGGSERSGEEKVVEGEVRGHGQERETHLPPHPKHG